MAWWCLEEVEGWEGVVEGDDEPVAAPSLADFRTATALGDFEAMKESFLRKVEEDEEPCVFPPRFGEGGGVCPPLEEDAEIVDEVEAWRRRRGIRRPLVVLEGEEGVIKGDPPPVPVVVEGVFIVRGWMVEEEGG